MLRQNSFSCRRSDLAGAGGLKRSEVRDNLFVISGDEDLGLGLKEHIQPPPCICNNARAGPGGFEYSRRR